MSRGIRLGSIGGVPISLDLTTFLLGALIGYSLGANAFPAVVEHQPAVVYWSMAAVATILFYLSLLAHELAHSLVARRQGVQVKGITLWLFGGVSQIQGENRTPGDEFRMAIVGPATSLGIAVLAAGLAIGGDLVGIPAAITAVVFWLGATNLLLGIFNLLPAFPLDGGRVLMSWLWHRRHDRVAAAATAATAGKFFGYGLMALGIAELMVDVLSGVWMMFIGWFLTSAAAAEAGGVRLQADLGRLTVGDVMSTDPIVVNDWITIPAFIQEYVLRFRHGAFPTRNFAGDVSGLVSLHRIRMLPERAIRQSRVCDVLIPLGSVIQAAPEQPLLPLQQQLSLNEDRRALVFKDGKLLGIVSPTDIAFAAAASELTPHQNRAA